MELGDLDDGGLDYLGFPSTFRSIVAIVVADVARSGSYVDAVWTGGGASAGTDACRGRRTGGGVHRLLNSARCPSGQRSAGQRWPAPCPLGLEEHHGFWPTREHPQAGQESLDRGQSVDARSALVRS